MQQGKGGGRGVVEETHEMERNRGYIGEERVNKKRNVSVCVGLSVLCKDGYGCLHFSPSLVWSNW